MNSQNRLESGVVRWSKCRFGVAFGYAQDDAEHAMTDAGEIEDVGCNNSNVIERGTGGKRFPISNYNTYDRENIPVAVFYGYDGSTQKLDSPKVTEALDSACGQCPYFQKKF